MPVPPHPSSLLTAKTQRNEELPFVFFATSRPCGQSSLVQRQGGALLAVVIGLMLVSILGASMAGLLYRSGHGQSVSTDLARARYLAESGMNYARLPGNLEKIRNTWVPQTIKLSDTEQFTVYVWGFFGVYHVDSTGSVGIGSGRETHHKIGRGSLTELNPDSGWDPDEGPPPVEESPVGVVEDDFDSGSLANWEVPKSSGNYAGFEPVKSATPNGRTAIVVSTDMSGSQFMDEDKEDEKHAIGHQVLLFNQQDYFHKAWADNDYQISYEAQVKMSWNFYRRYGAQGLAVLLRNRENELYKGATEGFYVSFMRYHSSKEEGEAADDYNSYDFDGIPNSIKPPGMAGHRLLVVWHQYSSGEKREWIAYKDLDHYDGLDKEDSVDWVMDWDDNSSGQCFKDFSTIAVRVIEAEGDKKYRYLQVLRADAKTDEKRSASSEGDDINKKRLAYLPTVYRGTFPQWSPLDFYDWSKEKDYFTLLATLSDDPKKEIQWDGVNPSPQATIQIMPDNGTIRTENYTTENSGTWDADRYEVGLHVTGNLASTLDIEMYFDEFAIRFLKTKVESKTSSSLFEQWTY